MKLVGERSKYEAFLRELEANPGNKPANVVARVKADYTARLADVVEKLKDSQEVLTKHVATLTEQLNKLEEAEKRFLDEAAELDLRKEVGELPEDEWTTAVARVKTDAAKIKSQHEVTAADIKRIRDVMASSAAAKTEPAPAAAPVGDELAFLKSVVGQSTAATPKAERPASPPAAPARTSAPTPAPRPSVNVKPIGSPPRPSTTSTPVQAPRPSVVAKERLIEPDPMDVEIGAPAAEAPAVKPVNRPTPPKESLIAEPQSEIKIQSKAARPLASNVPDGEMDLKSSGSQTTVKKTKCPKCRGLNIPSDWYCVHCGAELAI
jgi:hypothetical protein